MEAMTWKKWKGEDVTNHVLACLIAHYEGATYWWLFPHATCIGGYWRPENNRGGSLEYLQTMLVDNRDGEKVKAFDPNRGDEIFYTTLKTPDGHEIDPRFFRLTRRTEGGILMSEFEGVWERGF